MWELGPRIGSARPNKNGPAVATNNCYPGLTTNKEWLQMSIAVKYRESVEVKPQRIPEPELRGRNWRKPQTYLVGWPDGIVKVGCTSQGRERWGRFLTRGGTMLDISFYAGADAVYAETWLQDQIAEKYPRAFKSKDESKPYLGSNGCGYMECYRVPVSDWPVLIELARS